LITHISLEYFKAKWFFLMHPCKQTKIDGTVRTRKHTLVGDTNDDKDVVGHVT
jgi:hypothetical protein